VGQQAEHSQPLFGVLGGYLGDVYQRWIGTRELLLHGRDPYDVEVTREIQAAYYGRPLSSQEHRDEQRFAYPIFVVFLLAPTVGMPSNDLNGLAHVQVKAIAHSTQRLSRK
jgi:hypothetical protein